MNFPKCFSEWSPNHHREDAVASFANVGWKKSTQQDPWRRLDPRLPLRKDFLALRSSHQHASLTNLFQEAALLKTVILANKEASQKVSTLENELVALKAQIAKIIAYRSNRVNVQTTWTLPH